MTMFQKWIMTICWFVNVCYCFAEVSAGSCSFERGFCTWYNIQDAEKTDDFNWTFGSASTTSSFTADHKGNIKANFIFIDSKFPRKKGQKARLASQLFNQSSNIVGQCFLFYYHMHGKSIGSLNIYVNSSNSEKLVWMQSGTKENYWLYGKVDVGIATTAYRIIVEGVVGGSDGDIAVDDFSFYNGNCSANAEPTVNQSSTGKPTVYQSSTGNPTVNQSSSGKPTVNQSSTGKPTVNQSSTRKPTVNQPSTGKPTVYQSSTGKPTVNQSSTGKPTVNQSSTGKPTVNQSSTGKPTTASVKKTTSEYCLSDAIGDDTFKGKYSFNTTLVNTTSNVSCKYNIDKKGIAKRLCNWSSTKGGFWEDGDFSECDPKSPDTKKLLELRNKIICNDQDANESCISAEDRIKIINDVMNSSSSFTTPEDITLVTEMLEDVVNKTTISLRLYNGIFGVIDKMLSANSSFIIQAQTSKNSSRKMLGVLDALVGQIVNEVKELKMSYKVLLNSFALAIANVKKTDIFIKAVDKFEKQIFLDITEKVACDEKRADLNASILVPSNALVDEDNIIFSFVFKKPDFFLLKNDFASFHFNQKGETKNGTGIIASVIFSASVAEHSVKNLNGNLVKLNFKKTDLKDVSGSLDCYFWNSTLDSWSNAGCSKTYENHIEVLCECDHLTNLALILDPSKRGYNPVELKIVTWIGCGISIGALFISVLTLGLLRKLRQNLSKKILFYQCISLMTLLVLFLAGAERRSKSDFSCGVFAGLLQYFILATFFWTAVEALNLYRMFVSIFKSMDPVKFIRRACRIAWGVPLIIVAVSAGVENKSFGDDKLCLIHGYAFYFGVLLPVAVILATNFVVLILVMVKLSTRETAKLSTNHAERNNYRRVFESSRIAFAFSTLLGLTWVFALLAVGDMMEVFQWLFCIFNSLQGLFIFVLYIACNPEVQLQWRTLWTSLSLNYHKNSTHSLDFINLSFADSSDQRKNSSKVQLTSVYNLKPM